MDSHLFISSIRSQEEVSPAYFLLTMELPRQVKRPRPGNFFMVKASKDTDPLLRRPLSLHRLISEDIFQLLYRVKGRGTRILSEKMAGEKLDILGPLGRGFEIPYNTEEAILVAGGVGVAPLFPVAEELRNAGKSVKLFIGGKSKKDILCEKEFSSLGLEIFISTEDSSYGKGGLITELLEDYLKTVHSSRFTVHGERSVEDPTHRAVNGSRIYACGPKPMLKRVSELARIYSLTCYVSLEERMACGLGACLGCAVKIKVHSSQFTVHSKGKKSEIRNPRSEIYKMVCRDGPVFNSEEIDWDG